MTVNGIAPVLSPVLGGYVITAFDWRILFWTMAAIGGVLLVMSPAILRETRPATAAHASRQRPGQPVLKNRRFLRFCLIQAFMMAGLFSYIGSSSFVMQSEYGMSAMQFSLLFGLNGIGLIIAAMIFSRLARRFSAESLLRGGLTLAVSCAAIMLLFARLHLPVLALVGLFFTVSLMSGISTVAGAGGDERRRRRAVRDRVRADGHPDVCLRRHRRPLAGLGGETMLKMSLAMAICYLLALLLGLSKPRDAR